MVSLILYEPKLKTIDQKRAFKKHIYAFVKHSHSFYFIS